jgi:hypothetical protein
MERFNALGRGAQLMLIGSILLFIDMLFAWQRVDLPEPFNDYTRRGWYGAAGIILGLLVIVLLAWLIVRIASVNIPLPVSTAMTAALIGTLILIFAIIKFLSILGDEQTIWAWLGLVLAIVVAVGAFQTVQEAGGVDNLRTEASSLTGGSGAAAGSAQSADAAPPPPPAAPEPMTPMPEEPAAEPAAAPATEAMDEASEPAADAMEEASGGADDAGDDEQAPGTSA